MADLSEARAKAWQTRREKYGERGHVGAYRRSPLSFEAVTRMRDLIVKLHVDGVLSEGQACHATGLDRVELRRQREKFECVT